MYSLKKLLIYLIALSITLMLCGCSNVQSNKECQSLQEGSYYSDKHSKIHSYSQIKFHKKVTKPYSDKQSRSNKKIKLLKMLAKNSYAESQAAISNTSAISDPDRTHPQPVGPH